jgi:hypothetical protein
VPAEYSDCAEPQTLSLAFPPLQLQVPAIEEKDLADVRMIGSYRGLRHFQCLPEQSFGLSWRTL